jgi:putative membrane protein
VEQCHDVRLVGRFFGALVWHDFRSDHDIVFIVLTVLIITWALHAFGLGWQSDSRKENAPLETLKHRFARGEIDRAEYEDRKKVLSGS